jgi:hypothetical protein
VSVQRRGGCATTAATAATAAVQTAVRPHVWHTVATVRPLRCSTVALRHHTASTRSRAKGRPGSVVKPAKMV